MISCVPVSEKQFGPNQEENKVIFSPYLKINSVLTTHNQKVSSVDAFKLETISENVGAHAASVLKGDSRKRAKVRLVFASMPARCAVLLSDKPT